MDDDNLIVGNWYHLPKMRGQVFRYEGKNPDGAYVFSKFNGDPDDPGVLVSTVEVYNLGALEPWTSDG